jgi:hypothetical protein
MTSFLALLVPPSTNLLKKRRRDLLGRSANAYSILEHRRPLTRRRKKRRHAWNERRGTVSFVGKPKNKTIREVTARLFLLLMLISSGL